MARFEFVVGEYFVGDDGNAARSAQRGQPIHLGMRR